MTVSLFFPILVPPGRSAHQLGLFPAGTERHVIIGGDHFLIGGDHFLAREHPGAVADAMLPLLPRTQRGQTNAPADPFPGPAQESMLESLTPSRKSCAQLSHMILRWPSRTTGASRSARRPRDTWRRRAELAGQRGRD